MTLTSPHIPRFRTFFCIGDLPYEFGPQAAVETVQQLLASGASEVTIRRYIVDDNEKTLIDPNNPA